MLRKKFFNILSDDFKVPEWKNCLIIFCIAAIISTLLFLPFVIYNNGIFVFYGDYNAQQIPFYMLAHDAVREGNLGWSWTTDLGSNFIASYSFYLLGSPFFWLTIPFPTEALPYLMAPLFVLKFALAATTGYVFIRRFTTTSSSAMIGGLLYAFSGFMIYNIFFNHFHEVVVFFPLLLIGLEELVVNKRRGLFALAVAVNLIVNYYFFVGEVVFLILYFIFRCSSPFFKVSRKTILIIAVESLLGSMMGIILLIPSAIMVLQNPRVSEFLLGYDILLYDDVQRYGLILQSMFFPPDMPAYPNFFPDSNAKWSSVSAYIPMIGMAGVITFLKEKKGNWLRKLLIVLFIFMFIPILNSAFSAFNSAFYARWYYMLILMMALATAQSLENPRIELSFGIKVSFFAILAFAVIGILPSKDSDNNNNIVFGQAPGYSAMFWISVAIALVGIGIFYLLYRRYFKDRNKLIKGVSICLSVFILACGCTEIAWCKINSSDYNADSVIARGLNAEFTLDESVWNRIDVYNENYLDNWPMYWDLPSIQAFQSTVEPSIMEFYPQLGITRSVASRIPPEYYGLREFLSVKYIFVQNNEQISIENPNIPVGFSYYDSQNGFDIYQNEHFLPMGIPFTTYVDSTAWKNCPVESRDRLLLKGVYLTDVQLNTKYRDFLTPISNESLNDLSNEALLADTDKLAQNAAQNFTVTNNGFTCSTSYEQNCILTFTVPFDSGWSATIDGESTEIEKVDFGFMAIPVTAGEHQIEFTFHTPGLKISIGITAVGFLMYTLYMALSYIQRKRYPKQYAIYNNAQAEEQKYLYDEPTQTQKEYEWRRSKFNSNDKNKER